MAPFTSGGNLRSGSVRGQVLDGGGSGGEGQRQQVRTLRLRVDGERRATETSQSGADDAIQCAHAVQSRLTALEFETNGRG